MTPILRLVTPPSLEPLAVDAELKLQLHVDGSEEEGLLTAYIKAARIQLEQSRGIALLTQTWEMDLPGFPCDGGPIQIPIAPLAWSPALATPDSVKYLDLAGVSQTWAAAEYVVTPSSGATPGPQARRGNIQPAYLHYYPATLYGNPAAVTVRFTCGYGAAAADAPEPFRQALRLCVAESYLHREVSAAQYVETPAYEALVSSCLEWRVA